MVTSNCQWYKESHHISENKERIPRPGGICHTSYTFLKILTEFENSINSIDQYSFHYITIIMLL